jgi:P-type E1-E2 ATPase
MISGDNATTAAAIGSQLGIPASNIIAGVLPSEKADKIRWLQSHCQRRSGRGGRPVVAMVGDGINDSPALTAADVGIAIGSGSDIAISSAKFVLVSSNLYSLLTLIKLSRTVFRRVMFNFAWALVYNVVLLPIAAGAIYPVHGHPRLNPVWASLAMALSSLSVVCSSLVMRTRLPGVGFRAPGKQRHDEF